MTKEQARRWIWHRAEVRQPLPSQEEIKKQLNQPLKETK